MSMQDPISDLLTRIRNGLSRKHDAVTLPTSKVKEAIVEVLKNQGYIHDYITETVDGKRQLTVTLKYHNDEPVIETLKRISKPSLRIYKGADEINRINYGLGISIISTSKGMMSDKEARRARLGGEVICEVM